MGIQGALLALFVGQKMARRSRTQTEDWRLSIYMCIQIQYHSKWQLCHLKDDKNPSLDSLGESFGCQPKCHNWHLKKDQEIMFAIGLHSWKVFLTKQLCFARKLLSIAYGSKNNIFWRGHRFPGVIHLSKSLVHNRMDFAGTDCDGGSEVLQ